MKTIFYHVFLTLFALCHFSFLVSSQNNNTQHYAIVIHGGAGNFQSGNFDKELYNNYYSALNSVLKTGDSLLSAGVDAITVVEICIKMMEDEPLFNAGKGSVLTDAGTVEMDASIMDGRNLQAGAVSGVTKIKNPITAARTVMENSKHLMFSGQGAELFAEQNGIELVAPEYFIVDKQYKQYLELKKKDKGTVGAAVLDTYGNLAAGTSTGGMMMKQFGRIGDSPIIGAGTYADNASCAVSCTGHGEYFIRFVAAYDVSALMKYADKPIKDAVAEVLQKIGTAGGTGGIIALDNKGNITMQFNTTSMFRGYINTQGERYIAF